MVESGRISPEEANALLDLVGGDEQPGALEAQSTPAAAEAGPAQQPRIDPRPYLRYPLWGGLIVVLVGSTVVASAYQQGRLTIWTWLFGWLPLLFGLTVATAAAWARGAHWVHIRILDQDHRLTLAFPVPLRFAASVLGLARQFIPQLRETAVDELILTLRDTVGREQPMTIDIGTDEEGEHIQVHID
jgi:hypothetical protein